MLLGVKDTKKHKINFVAMQLGFITKKELVIWVGEVYQSLKPRQKGEVKKSYHQLGEIRDKEKWSFVFQEKHIQGLGIPQQLGLFPRKVA